MGMLEKIFGKKEQPAALKNAQIFRMLEGYTPAWTTWRGSIYESELIRSTPVCPAAPFHSTASLTPV